MRRTLRAHEARLRGYPNVVGFGIGNEMVDGERGQALAIRVYVSRKLPESRLARGERLPTRVRGVRSDGRPARWTVPVDVVRGAADLEALSVQGGRGLRGIFGNVGTVGLVFRTEPPTGRDYLLTNAHVAMGAGASPVEVGSREAAGLSTAVSLTGTGHRFADVERITELSPARVNDMDAALCWIYQGERIVMRAIRGESEPVVDLEVLDHRSPHRYFFVNRKGEKKTFNAPDLSATAAVTVDGIPMQFRGFLTLTGVPGARYLTEAGDSGSLLVRETAQGLVAAGLVFAGRDNTVAVYPMPGVLRRLASAAAGKTGQPEPVAIDFGA